MKQGPPEQQLASFIARYTPEIGNLAREALAKMRGNYRDTHDQVVEKTMESARSGHFHLRRGSGGHAEGVAGILRCLRTARLRTGPSVP
jgi:hypothetical protein